MFMVNGLADIDIIDSDFNKYHLDKLKQGDLIGLYSVLSGSEIEFSVIAKNHVRMLSLNENFFSHFSQESQASEYYIKGFKEAI